ncbi:NB-ARC domain-containing protein [Neobacillus drentensis]|uniref:NB-ARC domain-containing protein n=1 Tax=Neobacillus drentensis TaxID=220684 RepID=UPI003001FBB4
MKDIRGSVVLPSTKHPQVNSVLELFIKEEQPFRKIHRLIDLFEVIIKTHTSYLISLFLKDNRSNPEIKGMLIEALRTPSLGIWHLISRTLCDELVMNDLSEDEWEKMNSLISDDETKEKIISIYKQNWEYYSLKSGSKRRTIPGNVVKKLLEIREDTYFGNPNYVPGFFSYFYAWEKSVDTVIHMRNRYAHGATPSDEECTVEINHFLPVLHSWLNSDLLQSTELIIGGNPESDSDKQNNPFLVINHSLLDLFPIIQYKHVNDNSKHNFFFFNDLKKLKSKRISYLNYPLAENLMDKQIYEKFIRYIDLENWSHQASEEFKERIEELLESFKGRHNETKKIQKWIHSQTRGFLSIEGPPGVGKSAFMASFALEKHVVVKYFFRRGTIFAEPSYFFDYLNQQLELLFHTKIPFSEAAGDKRVNLYKRLKKISEALHDQKLVLIFDGIDELVHQLHQLLMTEYFRNVLIIYTSRKTPRTSMFYESLPIEHSDKMELGGLTKEDVRALLYENVNKYELSQEYIEKVVIQSEGNPLYIKLLCDALLNKEIVLNDDQQLPKKIEEFYRRLMNRFTRLANGEKVLSLLFTFGAAKDFLSIQQLEKITGFGVQEIFQAFETLQEVLIDQGDLSNYQLFHESFREYLLAMYPDNINESQIALMNYCMKWDQPDADGARKEYSFRYLSKHLLDRKDMIGLQKLTENDDFIHEQITFTNHYIFSFQLYQDAMALAAELQKTDWYIKICTKTLALHNKMADSSKDIVKLIELGGIQNIQLAISRTSIVTVRERAILIAYLLYQISVDQIPGLNKSQQENVISLIEKMCNEREEFIWNKIVNIQLLFQIMLLLRNKHLSYSLIIHMLEFDDELADLIKKIDINSSEILELLTEILQHVPDEIRLDAYLELAKKYREAERMDESLHMVNQALSLLPDSEEELKWGTDSKLIDELVEHGLYDKAIDVAIKFDSPGHSVYGEIATKLCNDHKVGDALALIESIQTRLNHEEALLRTDIFKKESPKSKIYHSVATHYLKLGYVKLALECAKNIHFEGMKWQLVNRIFEEVLLREDYLLAEEILADFPDTTNFVKLHQKYKENQDTYRENATFLKLDELISKEILNAKGMTDEKEKGNAIHSIALKLANDNRWDQALELVSEVSYVVKRDRILRDLANVSFKIHGIDKAHWVINQMERDWEKAEAYHSIGWFYLQDGCIQECKDIIGNIPNIGVRKSLYNHIIEYYINKGDVQEALSYLPFINNSEKLDNLLIAEIIKKLITNNHLKEGLELRKQIVPGPSYDRLTHFMTEYLTSTQSFEAAFALLITDLVESKKREDPPALKPKNLINTARYLFQNKRFDEFLLYSDIIENPKIKISLLSELADKDSSLFSQQLELMITMISKLIKMNDKAHAYAVLSKCCLRYDHNRERFNDLMDRAVEAAEQSEDDWSQTISWSVWKEVLTVYLEAGNPEKALAIVDKQQIYMNVMDGLITIADHPGYKNIPHKIELLEKAWEVGQKEDRKFYSTVELFIGYMIEAYIQIGEVKKAFDFLKENNMFYLVSSDEKDRHDVITYEVVDALLEQDEPDYVIELLSHIPSRKITSQMTIKLGTYYVNKGFCEVGEQHIQTVLTSGDSYGNYEEEFHDFILSLKQAGFDEKVENYISRIPNQFRKAKCIIHLAKYSLDKNDRENAITYTRDAFKMIMSEADEGNQAKGIKLLLQLPLTAEQLEIMIKSVQKMRTQSYIAKCIEAIITLGPVTITEACLKLAQEKLSYSKQKELMEKLVEIDPKINKKVELLISHMPNFLLDKKLVEKFLLLLAHSIKLNEMSEGDFHYLSLINEGIDISYFLEKELYENLSVDNLEEWIDEVNNPDIRLELQVIANAVKKGRMSPFDFEDYVKENLLSKR